jgi:hypothetical protein
MASSSPATADLCDAHIDTPVDTIADSSISVVLPNVLRCVRLLPPLATPRWGTEFA